MNLNGKQAPGAGMTLVLEDDLPHHDMELPDGTKIQFKSPMDLSERDEMEMVRFRRMLDMAQTRMNRAKTEHDKEKAVKAYQQAQNGYILILLPEMPRKTLDTYNRFQKNRIITFWNEQYLGAQRAIERSLDEMMDDESLGEASSLGEESEGES